jgi:hypothetical protein
MVPGNSWLRHILIVMGNVLYILAAVLIILWLIGYFGFNAGGLIHLLIFFAAIAILMRVIAGDKYVK